MPATPSLHRGLLLAVIGAVGFSGKAIIVKLAYRYGVDAVTLLMWRMLLALPLFLLLAAWAGRGQPRLTRADGRDVVLLGFTGYYLASALDFAGLQYISAGLERLILYLNPTLVLLLSVVRRGTPVRRGQLTALGLSYAGVLLAFAHELQGTGAGREIAWGSLLVLRPLSAAWVPAPVLGLSLLNATACTFVPVLCVMAAIRRIGAPLAAQVGMVGPMSTLLLAALLLDEPLTLWMLTGTALVLVGVAWVARR